MADNSTPLLASLLGIAPELRNQIYGYVANDPGTITIHEGSLVPHALGCACRQTRDEFLPVFQASKFEAGVLIKARVRNFDLRKFDKKMLDIWGGDAGPNMVNATVVITTTATDLSEMKPYDPYVERWFAMEGYEGALFCTHRLVFEVEVDCEALGTEGVALLASVLDGLQVCCTLGTAPIRLLTSPGPRQRRLMDRLKKLNVRAEFVESEASLL